MARSSCLRKSGDRSVVVTSRRCFHCGADIVPGSLVTESRGEEAFEFCCRGCQGAWLLITGSGFGDFYRRRAWREPGLGPGSFPGGYSDAVLSGHVFACGDQNGIEIMIEGIRCATCVWLNERIIGQLPGVTDVRVNYATNRARVLFEPATITPSAIFSRIAGIGYIPRPYTPSAAEERALAERKDLLVRFGTAFFLTMQLMAYSFALYAGYFQGIDWETKRSMQFFSLIVTTPVVFYAGWPFLRGGWRGVVNRAPSMDLLITTGALSSYGYSIYAMFTRSEVYFETAAMIVTLILAGRLLENAAGRRSAAGVERLLGLGPAEAKRVSGSGIETVAVAAIMAGDTVLISPGERFPVDGVVGEGTTEVDESPATGESLPVYREAGDKVIAGSINISAAVKVTCERPASDSFVARIARLVEEAQNRRAPIQGVADRTAALFVPAVLLLATTTFCWQYLMHDGAGGALMTALAVVVIACPCALGLATPTAILAGTGAAAASGAIFKGGDVLERMSSVTVAVFDKTGTVTAGEPEVVAITAAAGFTVPELAALAAAVECATQHPLARAVDAYARSNGMRPLVGDAFRTVPGGGVEGVVAGKRVAVGSRRFLADIGVEGMPKGILVPASATVAWIAVSGRYAGHILFRDSVRDEAAGLVAHFRSRQVRSILLSGDREEAVRFVAGSLGIAEWEAGMLPEEKAAFVEALHRKGETVLMVGDGINDAPALSAADVGCAIAGWTDIALETSDLVLARPDLGRIAFAHTAARRTMRVIRQNLGWAFIYNIVGIPLAMTGSLTPVYAAAAMALSSLCVVGNSSRLSGIKYE